MFSARVCHRAALRAFVAASLLAVAAGAEAEIVSTEFSGNLRIEGRWYPETAAYPFQRDHASGAVAAPKLYLEDDEGRSFTLAPFFRYDAGDPDRAHADLREAYLLFFGDIGDDQWELRLGVDRVFWGVAESRHLVDILNQVDLVEHPNEKAKLGQPMAHFTWSGDWGALELFGLPYHRTRTYPGRRGRLRGPLLIDNGREEYESGAGAGHLDLAARYSHSIGALDFGVSVFDGTAREPCLLCLWRPGTTVLVPYYEQIRQFGLDAQLTTGPWLLKLEAIRREGARDQSLRENDFAAFIIGGEYEFASVFDSDIGLTLFAEWLHDGRRRHATNAFQNDIFVAARLAFNDAESTDLTISLLKDLDYPSQTAGVEFNRRLSNQWSLHFEATIFLDVAERDLLPYATRRDSFAELHLVYSF